MVQDFLDYWLLLIPQHALNLLFFLMMLRCYQKFSSDLGKFQGDQEGLGLVLDLWAAVSVVGLSLISKQAETYIWYMMSSFLRREVMAVGGVFQE